MRRCAVLTALIVMLAAPVRAAEHAGQVIFAGLPVPGVTIVATQGEHSVTTSTDAQGTYRFPDLAAGVWSIRVEMLGFAPMTREVTVAAEAMPEMWALTLRPFAEIAASATIQAPSAPVAPVAASVPASRPRAPAAATAPPAAATQAAAAAPEANPFGTDGGDASMGAADGLLINGSVNNGAASPFAQPRAFGNARPGGRSLYNGTIGSLVGSSSWDARPFSFSTQQAPQPDYRDIQFIGTFGGPVRFGRLFQNAANVFVGYQRSGDTNATTQSALVPTALQRAGDFSGLEDPFGRQVRISDPLTGLPFPGNVIPDDRISPQARALLAYYPQPAFEGDRNNYQATILSETRTDAVQSRLTQSLTTRSQLAVVANYQRLTTTGRSLFGFEDQTRNSGLDTQATLFRRVSQFLSIRFRYQFTRLTSAATPHFANRLNVSGEAGIIGNDQSPENWGPPALSFASGIAGLSTAQHQSTANKGHLGGAEIYLFRGRHSLTFGGDARRSWLDIRSQQDPRGAFTFTGAFSGSDVADFLLGLPQASSIAFGNADKFFRSTSYDAYLTDDWRLGPSLTLNLGVRWEYESPITEARGRLANLDVVPGFGAVAPVVSSSPIGTLTGNRYPESLMRPDWRGIQPRLAAAWRPIPGSSLVVRAGYGIYRNTDVYRSIATLLAQQPPLSTTFSVDSAAVPLTLATGFVAGRSAAFNTFAVDPDFRVGYAHNWQVSAQRDLPASLTVAATYLGSKGSHLLQQFLPNTYPAGAVNPCPGCPAGFVYLTSGGDSLRHAAQVQLRRRLRNGLTATGQYTLSKATDNASAFTGGLAGNAIIAQDWLDLDAEQSLSSFDRRHQIEAQVQYTTGAGITGGTLIDGWKGRLFKDWTFTAQLNAGSGTPMTPIYLTSVGGTGVVGTVRASLTGADLDAVPDGYYLNPAAFAPPLPGEWGDAGRNSVIGPRLFSLNGSVARTFRIGERLNFDWRIDATNLLNRVTYSGVNMIVTSPQFGLPNRANTMRKIQSSLRVRF